MENCPYCNAEIEIDHDDGYGYEEDNIHEQSCSNCDKTFTFTTSVIYYYELNKCPCKNGGDHDLKQMHGAPRAFFVGREKCIHCDEEFTTDKAAYKRAVEEYYNPTND